MIFNINSTRGHTGSLLVILLRDRINTDLPLRPASGANHLTIETTHMRMKRVPVICFSTASLFTLMSLDMSLDRLPVLRTASYEQMNENQTTKNTKPN